MKALTLKEKGKKPVIFNSNDKLAEYWKISKAQSSRILSIIRDYKSIVEKYNIEYIVRTDEFIIPQRYIDQGFRRIDVEGKNVYVINREGTIINVANDRIIKGHPRYDGYIVVQLNNHALNLHRLVADMFVPNPNNYPIVNHINEDKTDNRADNLEWCTYRYNSNYGSAKDSSRKFGRGNHSKRVIATKGETKIQCPSLKEAARITGVDQKSIRQCCNKIRKSAKGYEFEFCK